MSDRCLGFWPVPGCWGSERCVMSAASIGSGKAAGYARYLEGKTVAPERGDYYLRPDGS